MSSVDLCFCESFVIFAKDAAKEFEQSSLPIAQDTAAILLAIAKMDIPKTPLARHPFPPVSDTLNIAIRSLTQNAPPSFAMSLFVNVARLCNFLSWRMAGGGKMPEIGVTEIIGPDGVIKNRDCRIGLFYQLPAFFYDYHQHEAEELYLQLCGQTTWFADGQPAKQNSGGAFIHHQSLQPHAMKTAAEPMLAIWRWSGNIAINSYTMHKNDRHSDAGVCYS